jgi:hypothetical protein
MCKIGDKVAYVLQYNLRSHKVVLFCKGVIQGACHRSHFS